MASRWGWWRRCAIFSGRTCTIQKRTMTTTGTTNSTTRASTPANASSASPDRKEARAGAAASASNQQPSTRKTAVAPMPHPSGAWPFSPVGPWSNSPSKTTRRQSDKVARMQQGDLTRILLAVVFTGALVGGSLWILQPFLGAIIWAVMIVVATWPVMRWVQRQLGGHRWAAVTVMSVLLLLVLIVPVAMAVGTLVGNIDIITGWAKNLGERL